MEAVEAAGIENEFKAFGFEHLPDRLIDQFRVAKSLGRQDGLTARCLRYESRVFIQTRKQGERGLPYFVHYRAGS
ncbi:hypothetical protein GGD64_008409 [Bradyrhizobium sp. CIR3A]|nr:hypothetical protein [Bradyrhizobium sp. CIR3A]